MRLLHRWVALGLAMTVGVACGTTGQAVSDSTPQSFVTCQLVPRFRFGDIEYENERFDNQVATADLGPVVGKIERHPAALDRCETVVLKEGEGSLPPGTEIHEILGVDATVSFAASLGNGVYLKFDAHTAAAP